MSLLKVAGVCVMFLKVILTFLFFKSCRSEIILPLIDDLITYDNNTQIILGFFCNKEDGVLLLRHFSSRLFQINVLPLNTSRISYPIPPSRVTFILYADCPNAKQLLVKANEAKLFADPFKWIIYYKNPPDMNELTRNYFKLDILVDSDVTVAVMKNENSFNVMKIYKRHIKTAILMENVGTWIYDKGLILIDDFEKITYKRRRNLGKTIVNSCIVLTNNDSINHLTDKRDIHIDSIAKANFVLVQYLADTVNVSLNYSVQSTWGYKDKDEKWSGMIGELTRKEADIGGTALFMTLDRVDIIDYIAMPSKTLSKFIFRQPKLSYVANVFTLPFDQYVWASICSLLLIIAVVLYIGVKWEWKKKKYIQLTSESNDVEIRNSWSEVFFETYAAFCQQGTYSIPYSIPGRITLIFLLVSFMFLYTSYSANIVALLQSSSTSIRTLEDILHSRIDVGVDDTVFNHFYFPNATEPIRRALYLKKVAPSGQKPRFYSTEEGIRKMRKGLFAFHVETGPGYKFVSEIFREDEKCGLQEISFLQVSDPWLAIQKNSSYKKMLKVGLRLLQENGIQEREVGLIYTKKPQCLSRGSSFISVGLVDCYPAAVVLAGGIVISVVILILELFLNQRIRHYYKRKKKLQDVRQNEKSTYSDK